MIGALKFDAGIPMQADSSSRSKGTHRQKRWEDTKEFEFA